MPNRFSIYFTLFVLLLVIIIGCVQNPVAPTLSDAFHDIQTQTLQNSCVNGCHDKTTQRSLLILDKDSSYSQLMNHKLQRNGTKFQKLVIPGNPDSSFLYYKITTSTNTIEYGERMPSRLTAIAQNQIDAIKSWILRGAPND